MTNRPGDDTIPLGQPGPIYEGRIVRCATCPNTHTLTRTGTSPTGEPEYHMPGWGWWPDKGWRCTACAPKGDTRPFMMTVPT